jgi:predicted DNA-binding protein (MmcQ/YjbR family)
MTVPFEAVDRVRAICLSLPEAEERETWGEPTFRVRDKIFALIRRGDGRLSFWCKAAPGIQPAMIASDPGRYFYPPYVGHKGWVGVRIDGDVDWDDLADVLTDSYRLIAPKRLAALLPTSGDG